MIDDAASIATHSGTIVALESLSGEDLRHLASLADEREARALPPEDEELRESLWRTATLRMQHDPEQAAIVRALSAGVHPLLVAREHMVALLRARFGTDRWPTVGFYRRQLEVAA